MGRPRYSTMFFMIVAVAILPVWTVAAAPVTLDPFVVQSARLDGMGGTHAALNDDFSTLFSNPAGFTTAKDEFSFAALSFSSVGPIFDIVSSVSDYLTTGVLDLGNVIGADGLRTGLSIGGPLAFGWIGRGLGFGFFNSTDTVLDVEGTDVSAEVNEDLLLAGGYAFRFPLAAGHALDLGFLAKGYLRGSVSITSSLLTITDLFSSDILMASPTTLVAGVGFDVGLRYEWAKLVSVGIVCHDAYSPAVATDYASLSDLFSGGGSPTSYYAIVSPSLDAGTVLKPRIPFLDRYISDYLLALDYRDFLDLLAPIPRNPVLNVALGTEFVFLDVLSVRAGVADALPNLGVGLDLSFMKLDFAMRGVELGLDPGDRSVFVMDLGLSFRY